MLQILGGSSARLGDLISQIPFPRKGSSNGSPAFNNSIWTWSASWGLKGFYLSFKSEGPCMDCWTDQA